MSSVAAKILLVKHEAEQRESLARNLHAEGWTVCQAIDGEDALLTAEETRPDAVVLDWMLPTKPGVEVCSILKRRPEFRKVPIILLPERSVEIEIIRGQDNGADDYVFAPYTTSELASRLRANLRRLRPTFLSDVLTFNEITLNSNTQRVVVHDAPMHLGPTEFRLLAVLLERPGYVWSRESLLDRVWGKSICIDVRTVDCEVARLRKALQQENNKYPIKTVRGAGYTIG